MFQVTSWCWAYKTHKVLSKIIFISPCRNFGAGSSNEVIYIYLEIDMFYCFHKVFYHFLNVCSVCDCLTKRKKKMNYIFLEPGICRIAYRHTEVWHTCLFIDVSSGQIYFVKHSRVGKITKQREKTVWKILFQTAASCPFFSWLKFSEFFCKLNNSHLKYKVCHSFSRRWLIFLTAPAWCLFFFFFFYWVLPEGTSA